MSDRFDNGYEPQMPPNAGGDETRPESPEANGPIMLSNAGPMLKPLSFWASVAWCVASGACAGISPIIAPLFVGFGYALLAGKGGAREDALAAVAMIVPAVLVAMLTRFAGIEDAVFACIVGMTASHLYLRGKLTPGVACLSVGVLGLLFLAASEGVARTAGTTLAAQFDTILGAYLASMGELSIEARAVVEQMRTIVDAIWPTAFVMIAFVGFVLSIGGTIVAARRQGIDISANAPYETFDLPLWAVACLIAAILILAASQAVPAFSAQLMMVGGTLVGSLRLAFATQGYAVLSWFKNRRGWRGILGLVITIVAFYLEFNLFVLTIIGVLDIWANFRRLSRGVRVTIQDPTDQR